MHPHPDPTAALDQAQSEAEPTSEADGAPSGPAALISGIALTGGSEAPDPPVTHIRIDGSKTYLTRTYDK